MTFEHPRAGLIALAALLPLLAFAASTARARRIARVLGLDPAPVRSGALPAVAAALACVLLGAAAARPALVGGGERRVRTDSEILFVVDVTRSMLAAPARAAPTRLARARQAALTLREAVPGVPAALAGLTDRVLPYAFASPDLAVFAETLDKSATAESPPPRTEAVVATAFDALATIADNGFFGEGVSHRTCVLVTDGESRSFLAGVDRRACRLLVVRVGTPRDRIWGETAYRADPDAARNVERLAAVTGGQAFSDVGAAAEALRSVAEVGPTRAVRVDDRNRSLAAFPAAAALAIALALAGAALATRRVRVAWVGAVVLAAAMTAAGDTRGANVPTTSDWRAFGRTPDNLRHSPLQEITRANVAQLRRAYTIDFQAVDPDVRRGQQSYSLAIGGRLFVTTNDGNVFAIHATTGRILWQYKPRESAVFKNFGIVANRGLAFCARRLFLAQLDMKLVALRPRDGRVLAMARIDEDVPNASPNFGYSETSAPVCANGRVVIGAAGSEYGIRGFVMAYTPDLRPAWPSPFWTIPPDRQSWRRASRIVGGGAVWTPVTIDAATSTVYFGTGAATPHFVASIRPGPNPRTNALVAVDLRNGRLKWWRQLIARNEWGYDVAQPPLVYTDDGRRIVSVATMEGVWFAFDARTGEPLHERVRVIDRVEHPQLQPGRVVRVYPATLGGLNYSPASYDAQTGYVFNAAAETAVAMKQQPLEADARQRKTLLGDVFLGLENGDFGQALRGWHDHGSLSAIDVATGRRIWKIRTPEPERGGVTTTASGLGFAGGGDGLLRAFDLRNGRVLWTFDTGDPIASGVTVFAAGGREHVAVTVGGTPTSSNGGTVSKLMVFRLGARELAPPRGAFAVTTALSRDVPVAHGIREDAIPGRIAITGGAADVEAWRASSANLVTVRGRVLLRERPVRGVRVMVGRYLIPNATDANGVFAVSVDATEPRRFPVRVSDAADARIDGRAATAVERSRIVQMRSGVNVGYRLSDVSARVRDDGAVVVRGRVARAPSVTLLTYRLTGRVTDARGRPVARATVVTRTLDRNYWTFSAPSDARGRYLSFFPASDEIGSSPVPMSVQVALGLVSHASADDATVSFERLSSATMNVHLTSDPESLPVPRSTPEQGAIYRGLLVGASGPGGLVRPIAATWPDRDGAFELVLPSSVRGRRLRLWQYELDAFSRTPARPGGAVDPRIWPESLPPSAPRDVAMLRVGG